MYDAGVDSPKQGLAVLVRYSVGWARLEQQRGSEREKKNCTMME